jgi:hypothetical protein
MCGTLYKFWIGVRPSIGNAYNIGHFGMGKEIAKNKKFGKELGKW